MYLLLKHFKSHQHSYDNKFKSGQCNISLESSPLHTEALKVVCNNPNRFVSISLLTSLRAVSNHNGCFGALHSEGTLALLLAIYYLLIFFSEKLILQCYSFNSICHERSEILALETSSDIRTLLPLELKERTNRYK